MTPLIAIAAMSENRAIGHGNQIPWHLPEDFKFFKATTMGHVLIMGRKTFESIGRPLPGRETIVLSRTGFSHPGVKSAATLEAARSLAGDRKVFVCGGAEIYRLALPLCEELYLTHVKRRVDGDAFFPPFEDAFETTATLLDNADFRVAHYRRKSANTPGQSG